MRPFRKKFMRRRFLALAKHKPKHLDTGKTERKPVRKPEAKPVPAVTHAKTSVRNNQEVGSVLSGEQKKRLGKQKMKEKKERKVPHSAQQSISYQEMFKDGICRVDDRHYTKCIQFGRSSSGVTSTITLTPVSLFRSAV